MFPTKWTIYQARLALPDNEVREPTEHQAPTNMDMKERMSDGGARATFSSSPLPSSSSARQAIKGEEAAVAVQWLFCLFVF